MRRMPVDLSHKASNLGFVCVCLVVFMHIHCPWEGGGINQLAVPFFFLMSGYFLAAHTEEAGWYRLAVQKRMRTLLIPLFLWCVLWTGYSIAIAAALNLHAGRSLTANLLTGWGSLRYLALDITRTPAMGPLWYVRCLFLFVLISPAVVALVRKLKFGALLVTGASYVTYASYGRVVGSNIDFLSYGFSLEGLSYFSFGIYLQLSQHPLSVSAGKGAVAFATGLVAYWFGITELSILLMIVGLWGLMPSRPLPKILTSNTFPIYLIHMFVLLLAGSGKISSPIISIAVGVGAVLVSLIVAVAMKKLLPRTSSILFGGR